MDESQCKLDSFPALCFLTHSFVPSLVRSFVRSRRREINGKKDRGPEGNESIGQAVRSHFFLKEKQQQFNNKTKRKKERKKLYINTKEGNVEEVFRVEIATVVTEKGRTRSRPSSPADVSL